MSRNNERSDMSSSVQSPICAGSLAEALVACEKTKVRTIMVPGQHVQQRPTAPDTVISAIATSEGTPGAAQRKGVSTRQLQRPQRHSFNHLERGEKKGESSVPASRVTAPLSPGDNPLPLAFPPGSFLAACGRIPAGNCQELNRTWKDFKQTDSGDHREESGTPEHDQRFSQKSKIKVSWDAARKKRDKGHSSRGFPEAQVNCCRQQSRRSRDKGTESGRFCRLFVFFCASVPLQLCASIARGIQPVPSANQHSRMTSAANGTHPHRPCVLLHVRFDDFAVGDGNRVRDSDVPRRVGDLGARSAFQGSGEIGFAKKARSAEDVVAARHRGVRSALSPGHRSVLRRRGMKSAGIAWSTGITSWLPPGEGCPHCQ